MCVFNSLHERLFNFNHLFFDIKILLKVIQQSNSNDNVDNNI